MAEDTTTEPLDENKLLSPLEAVEFLNEYRGARVTVDILRQMRRKGRVKGMQLGGENSRTTVYRLGDLLQADISRRKSGRPKVIDQEAQEKEGYDFE